MIIYLADRHMNIVATCSNNLPKGLKFQNDLKSEDVESGVATFSVDILYDEEDAQLNIVNRETMCLSTMIMEKMGSIQ